MPLRNNVIMNDMFVVRGKEKHTVGLEPTISCSVGKRLIQLGYACLFCSLFAPIQIKHFQLSFAKRLVLI